MGVPAEIRAVERPVNTVVVDRGGTGPRRWAVVERVGCRRVGGRNLPVNGGTVGHIVAGRYVPLDPAPVASSGPDIRGWADAAVVHRAALPLLDELLSAFDAGDAVEAYVLACMRVLRPGIACRSLSGAYGDSWLSVEVPGAQLSRNKVSSFLAALGSSYPRIVAFMRARCARVAEDHHVVVDGTLKQDTSTVNDLSRLSRRARVRGTRDVSEIWAFDVEEAEPLCSKVYPGNVVDEVAYGDFLAETGIERGVLMGDKAFRRKAAEASFADRPGLHWLNPLRRSDRRIRDHAMYEWEGRLEGTRRDVLYRKVRLRGGCFLYSFYDRARAAKEEADFFRRTRGSFDAAKAKVADERFGTVVFESDLDLDPGKVYAMYEERWEIEVTFRYYKDTLDLDETRVQSDASVIGSEFVSFLATVISSRLVKEFDAAGLLDRMTYGQVMDDLRSARRVRLEPGGDWTLARTTVHARETLVKLGLVEAEPRPERKRGRPKGSGKRQGI